MRFLKARFCLSRWLLPPSKQREFHPQLLTDPDGSLVASNCVQQAKMPAPEIVLEPTVGQLLVRNIEIRGSIGVLLLFKPPRPKNAKDV